MPVKNVFDNFSLFLMKIKNLGNSPNIFLPNTYVDRHSQSVKRTSLRSNPMDHFEKVYYGPTMELYTILYREKFASLKKGGGGSNYASTKGMREN